MTHPGRLESFVVDRVRDCQDCGAEFVERRSGGASVLVCPWSPDLPKQVEAGVVSCGRPYTRPELDQAREYVRDKSKKARRP